LTRQCTCIQNRRAHKLHQDICNFTLLVSPSLTGITKYQSEVIFRFYIETSLAFASVFLFLFDWTSRQMSIILSNAIWRFFIPALYLRTFVLGFSVELNRKLANV